MSSMLTARQISILENIIHFFANTGEAVGSQTIAQQTDIEASPATIRNEMKLLEEKGFIQKNHLSSGRVPSMQGYRFYLDHIMQPEQPPQDSIARIAQELSKQFQELDDIVNQSAQILSDLTNYTAIVLGPKALESRLTDLKLVKVNANQVMAIVETDGQTIKSSVFRVGGRVSRSLIDRLSDLLKQELQGLLLSQVHDKLDREIPFLVRRSLGDISSLLSPVINSIEQADQNQVHISGKNKLFNFTEDLGIDQIKGLFDLFEDHEHDLSRLVNLADQGVNIRIGEELNDERFNNLSLITVDYSVGNIGSGLIAILGPTNMPYSKTLGVIEGFKIELVEALLNYYIH